MSFIFKNFKANLLVVLLLKWHQTAGAFLATIGTTKIATVLFLATLKSTYAKSNQKIIERSFPPSCQELGLIGSRKRRQAGPQGTYICLLSVKQLHLRQNQGAGAVHRSPKRSTERCCQEDRDKERRLGNPF